MDKINALAEYFGIDPETINEEGENYFDCDEGEFLVLTDEEADRQCKYYIEDCLDDMGLDSFTPRFQDWIVDNAIDEREVDSFIEDEISYFENEEDEDMLEYLNSLNDFSSKINYIRDLYGDTESFSDWAVDHLDTQMITDEAIEEDGRGHFLASYDGEELELPGDFFGYRVN